VSTNAALGLPGSVDVVVVVGAAVLLLVLLVVGAAVLLLLVVGAAVLVVGAAVLLDVVAVVLVVEPWQTKPPPADPPLPPHASQQLGVEPTHATVLPRFCARHLASLLLIEHLTLPFWTRQQVTNPGFPQIEFAAQRMTSPLHCVGSAPVSASCFTTSPTHFTYCP